MVNNKDLRIGNYINYEQTTHRIIELSEDTCTSEWNKAERPDPYTHPYSEITGIPLTEKWLLKLGMINNSNEWSIKSKEITFILENFNNKYYYTGGEGVILSEPINYVHQLQNLCKAITGEELSI